MPWDIKNAVLAHYCENDPYRLTSNKTQLTEFPESKSDMPLFHWVLALK